MINFELSFLKRIRRTINKQQASARVINKQLQPMINAINQVQKSIEVNFRPLLKQIEAISQSIPQFPNFRRRALCQEVGINNHPVLDDLFEGEFDKETLQTRWPEIQEYLWERRKIKLLGEYGEDRYKQLLAAQNVGAYIAVCRATYAEIEGLIREEIFKKDDFNEEYLKQETDAERRRYTSQQVRKMFLIDGILSDDSVWGIDGDQSWSELGLYTMEFIRQLEGAFKSFDPEDARKNEQKNGDLNNNRHFHAHGWSKRAKYLDGLNALLLFDYAMDVLAKQNSFPNNEKNKVEAKNDKN